MTSGVFVLTNDDNLVAMEAASFASEDDFQRLLGTFPELLAGDQIDLGAPRRFFLVDREVGVASEEEGAARWSLDHLFIDQDAIPTLVEVKRSTDTRIRREVVGQMLDYAANSILYWPVEALRGSFEARCEAEGKSPREVLTELVGEGADPQRFWGQVQTNLQAGRIRLLFVADKIPSELRRVVEFLNRQMQPAEVLAIELRQYQGQGLKTLVPVVIGKTEDAIQKKSSSGATLQKRSWTKADILADIEGRGNALELDAAARIANWIEGHADRVEFNENVTWGWMGAAFRVGTSEASILRLHSDASVAVYFQYMLGRPVVGDEAFRAALLTRLNAVPGIRLPPDAISKRKTIRLSALTHQSVSEFLGVMDWLEAAIRGMPPS